MDFNFTDPMVLSNAIIFHDSVSNQIRGTEYSEHSFYTPPSYPTSTASEYPWIGGYNVASEYKIPLPIEDTLNTPYTIEDIITGREYVKMIMGMLEETLIVSILLSNPKVSELKKILLFIKERIKEFQEDKAWKDIILVISGEFSQEFKEMLKENFYDRWKEIDDKIIISLDKRHNI